MINMKNIMFVCYGNICRSPMAEYIFKYLTKDKYNITSRATSTDEIGHDIYPPAKEVLDKNNIPYSKHHATQITQSDYDTYDIIVCFDTLNYDTLKRRFNDNNKVIKLCDYDIDDPWYTREFDRCYKEIYEGCLELINKI